MIGAMGHPKYYDVVLALKGHLVFVEEKNTRQKTGSSVLRGQCVLQEPG